MIKNESCDVDRGCYRNATGKYPEFLREFIYSSKIGSSRARGDSEDVAPDLQGSFLQGKILDWPIFVRICGIGTAAPGAMTVTVSRRICQAWPEGT